MGKVRLREVAETGENGAARRDPIELKPLRLSGIVVRKAHLIEALRAYVPTLRDIQVTEDGEHYWLLISEGGHDGDSPED